MFESLTERLSGVVRSWVGKGSLTEDNIAESLAEVRRALLEADVALPVVTDFIDQVKAEAIGKKITESLSPGQVLVKLVNDGIIQLLGEANDPINLKAQPPVCILMAGLQGAGKTTSVAKLALFLKERLKKRVLVASADVYRPAAIAQLEVLSKTAHATFFPSDASQLPVSIAKAAYAEAVKKYFDVVIIDTAGRLHIDEQMMNEIKAIHAAVKPMETFFVIDAMTGQDAVNTAKVFNEALPLTGIILTKVDGDTRGGAALSVRKTIGKPIKFLGMGEKIESLEPFHPDRLASRILGMGDILSLIEDAERKMDKGKADQLVNKMKKGEQFDLNDLLDQFRQLKKMGGIMSLLDKLPFLGADLSQNIQQASNDKVFSRMEAIVLSMTQDERRNPDVIDGSRKRRIAGGSGTDVQDVNRLLKQHKQMQKMFKKVSKKGSVDSMVKNLQGAIGAAKGGRSPF